MNILNGRMRRTLSFLRLIFFGEQNMLEKENLVGYIFIFGLIKFSQLIFREREREKEREREREREFV